MQNTHTNTISPSAPLLPHPSDIGMQRATPALPTSPVIEATVELVYPTNSVEKNAHVHKGTGFHKTLAYVVGAISFLAFVGGTAGVGLLSLIAAPIAEAFRWKKVRALIRGSGVHVAPNQLPFLHKMVNDFSKRLGMTEVPEVYVVEDSLQNGAAMKLGTKNVILLSDDVIWGALQSRDPRALGFVVGHELAHIALGHTKTIRHMLGMIFKPLGRDDEYTADNIATALVGDAKIAVHGITVLTVGPQLLPYINDTALMQQAKEMFADKHAKKAEKTQRHPLLLRRIANVVGMR